MAHLSLEGLTKRYGAQTVLDGISLGIKRGQLVCLLGPSGCGKTTTLRLIAGFVEPTAGIVRVGERILSSQSASVPPERRGMSMIFQSYALWPHMSVFENVAYGLTLRSIAKAEIERIVRRMLAATKLEHLAHAYPGELSGGQQQRVALARALVVEPEILLLDEPLSNLDAALREEMRYEIRRLHDEFRYTTVYVTHDQVEAMTAADVIVVMNAGRIEQIGSPEDVYSRPASRFVAQFLGGANILIGIAKDDSLLDIGVGTVRAAEPALVPGTSSALTIRHHDVRIALSRTENALPATITRQTFLGPSRDLFLSLEDGTVIRASAPTDLALPSDGKVWLILPAEKCRPIMS